MSIIVAKFGGTSMGSTGSIKQVAEIILTNKRRLVVVVSAVAGVTDLLLTIGKTAEQGGDWRKLVEELKQRHEIIKSGLGLAVSLDHFYEEVRDLGEGIELLREFSPRSSDQLVSMGERLSATLLYNYLLNQRVDCSLTFSSEYLKTNADYGNAAVDLSLSQSKLAEKFKPALSNAQLVITTGFIGSDPQNHLTTLGRGGSDYSAAILANLLEAELLEIWTDVNGIMTVDPRLVPEAATIPEMNYDEAAELSYFGAKVLHPKTIRPAVVRGIPVKVLNTFAPDKGSTLISAQVENSIKSVTYKKNITIVNICSTRMLDASGFLKNIFSLFAEHNLSIDVIATSEVSVSLTVDKDLPAALLTALRAFSMVEVFTGRAIICLVGEKIREMSGVAAKLFSAVAEFPIEMISQGASQRNITLLMNQEQAPDAVKNIYYSFFN